MRFEFTDEDMRRWRAAFGVGLIVLGLAQVALWALEEAPRTARLLVAAAGLITAAGTVWRFHAQASAGSRVRFRWALAVYLLVVGGLVIVAGFGTALAVGWMWGVALAAIPWEGGAR